MARLTIISSYSYNFLMIIQESAEMYLETIISLQNQKGNVRAIDISREMGFSRPTVSIAVHKLEENGYLKIDESGFISLLPPGKEIAEKILERHNILKNVFIRLGVSEKTAEKDACRIEHVISEETFDCLKKHINSFKQE